MDVNFDIQSLEISNRKVITGTISVVVGNKRLFPEETWNDAIVIVLNSWIQNMIQILTADHIDAQFVFFDGPFSFVIRKNVDQSLVELFRNSQNIETYNLDLKEFGCNLLTSSQEVIKEINNKGWESEDVVQLGLSIERMLSYLD